MAKKNIISFEEYLEEMYEKYGEKGYIRALLTAAGEPSSHLAPEEWGGYKLSDE